MQNSPRLFLITMVMALARMRPQECRRSRPHDIFHHQRWLRQGEDLGGLAGADRHCQALAQAVGAGNRTWHAYLSTSASGGQPLSTPEIGLDRAPGRTPKGWSLRVM